MLRALIFGGSGWLGAAVVPAFRARFVTFAPSHAEADVSDAASVARTLDGARPDVVVNLAALQPSGGDEAAMARVNVAGAEHVARCAAARGARLVHMSTDLVLDGRSPPYPDGAPANPVNAYGRTKADGERRVVAACPAALVLRTSLVFDATVPDRFTRSVMDRLARGESAALFTDEVRCPIARGTLAAAIAELAERGDVAGFLNVAGTERVTRFDFGMRLLRAFGAAGTELVRPALAATAPEPRPLDLTLDVSRARSVLATPLRGVDDEIRAVRSR